MNFPLVNISVRGLGAYFNVFLYLFWNLNLLFLIFGWWFNSFKYFKWLFNVFFSILNDYLIFSMSLGPRGPRGPGTSVPTQIIAPLKKGYTVAPETPILTSFFYQKSWFFYINQYVGYQILFLRKISSP